MFTKTQENNNDPVKTHIVGNEIGNNQLKLEKMEYHGTKNLNILDSIDQQKERFQFTKPTVKQKFDEFKKFGIGINTIGHPLYEKASKK